MTPKTSIDSVDIGVRPPSKVCAAQAGAERMNLHSPARLSSESRVFHPGTADPLPHLRPPRSPLIMRRRKGAVAGLETLDARSFRSRLFYVHLQRGRRSLQGG